MTSPTLLDRTLVVMTVESTEILRALDGGALSLIELAVATSFDELTLVRTTRSLQDVGVLYRAADGKVGRIDALPAVAGGN